MLRPLATLACLTLAACTAQPTQSTAQAAQPTAQPAASPDPQTQAKQAQQRPPIVLHGQPKAVDHSGRRVQGKASVYHPSLAGRRMADQNRYNPRSNAAASKILPLGTEARVTNLDNGKTATVKVEDRGPHVDGRVVDLSSATAAELGLTRKDGVAPVEIAPIAVPQTDGSVKPGAGAAR